MLERHPTLGVGLEELVFGQKLLDILLSQEVDVEGVPSSFPEA